MFPVSYFAAGYFGGGFFPGGSAAVVRRGRSVSLPLPLVELPRQEVLGYATAEVESIWALGHGRVAFVEIIGFGLVDDLLAVVSSGSARSADLVFGDAVEVHGSVSVAAFGFVEVVPDVAGAARVGFDCICVSAEELCSLIGGHGVVFGPLLIVAGRGMVDRSHRNGLEREDEELLLDVF